MAVVEIQSNIVLVVALDSSQQIVQLAVQGAARDTEKELAGRADYTQAALDSSQSTELRVAWVEQAVVEQERRQNPDPQSDQLVRVD